MEIEILEQLFFDPRANPIAEKRAVGNDDGGSAWFGRALEFALKARFQARSDVAVEAIYCLGLCACGPAVMVDGVLVGLADVDAVEAAL